MKEDLRDAAMPWLVARVLVLAAWVTTVVGANVLGAGRTLQQHQGLFAWDAAFYRDLADAGYRGGEALRFFPLYPMLAKVLSVLTLGRVGPVLVLLANGAALVAGVLAVRLLRAETGDRVAGVRAAWMLALFPSAFVLVWGYAEGIYIALAMGAFFALRRDRWWLAAGLGAAAALCRPVGAALALAAAAEVARQWRDAPARDRVGRVAAVAGPVLAVAAYLAWVGARFDDWQAPLRTQETLRGGFEDPVSRLIQGFRDLAGSERLGDGLHVPFALAFIALLVVVARRLPASYTVYSAAIVLLALSAENLNSLERYGLNAFPLVFGLALVSRDATVERSVVAISSAGLLALTALAWWGAYVP